MSNWVDPSGVGENQKPMAENGTRQQGKDRPRLDGME